MNTVTVIIPNLNGKQFLGPCLDALKNQSFSDFSVTVVDDGSSDGSADYLAENYPWVNLSALPVNGGFCKAVNAGVKQADSEYVILLNNDTVADPAFVEKLYAAIKRSKKIFSVSACMLDAANPELLDGAGDLYNLLGWASARGKGLPAENYKKRKKIFSSCGGAAIYNTALFKELGYLDEEHFAYLEDLDLGYRAQLFGYKNFYAPEAKVLHIGSATTGSRYNSFKIRSSARNNIYVLYKNMPLPQLIPNFPFLLVGFLVKFAFFQKKGFGADYSLGIAEGFALTKGSGKNKKLKYEGKKSGIYFRIQLQLWKNLFTKRK